MHWRARTWIDPAAEHVAELVLGLPSRFFFCCYNGMFFHSVLAPGWPLSLGFRAWTWSGGGGHGTENLQPKWRMAESQGRVGQCSTTIFTPR